MHTLEVKTVAQVPVKYLQAVCDVRYWEDATVDGVDDEDGMLIPCRQGNAWAPLIELETGKIQGWPQGKVASIHYKVCDAGTYSLLSEEKTTVARIDGYVPSIMCPEPDGFGDYIIMKVDGEGQIQNWTVDLADFERN